MEGGLTAADRYTQERRKYINAQFQHNDVVIIFV